jgi:hypothetical protein
MQQLLTGKIRVNIKWKEDDYESKL